MKILLINDNSAHPNWGAQATPYALMRILQRSIPKARITSLSWDWLRHVYRVLPFFKPARYMLMPPPRCVFTKKRRLSLAQRLLHRVSRPVHFYPAVADDFAAHADMWLRGHGGPDADEFMKLARNSDIVIYNGENSIYRNTREGCHGLFLLWFAKTRLGKPSCLVNHTAQLNEVQPIMNAMVHLVANTIDLVAVREPRSLSNLHQLGINNATLFPDVVFAEDPTDFSADACERWRRHAGLDDDPYFCLSASGLPLSQPRGAWNGAVGDLVAALKKLGLRPILVARDPHCQFLAEVAKRTGSLYFGPEHRFADLWSLFRDAVFSVTGHFHYIIMGASVGCPFIPLSNNNHKIHGVCEMLQWQRTTPFDATWLTSCQADIVQEAQRIRANRQQLSAQLKGRTALLRTQARALGRAVRDVVQNTGASQEAGSES